MSHVRPVAIIGAGYAGLACAVELARAGVHVQVYERSLTLGGRARVVNSDGWRVDNGQHILMGAYTELTRLMRLTGVSPKVLEQRPMVLHTPGGLHLQNARLPAPLHLAVGLLRARGLSWADRLAAVRLMSALKKTRFRLEGDYPVSELLQRTGQTSTITARLWEPLCVAALNTPASQASAQVFAHVLRDTLAADAAASQLLLPRVDLSELFPVPAVRYLATRRGLVDTGCRISAIRREADGFRLEGAPGNSCFRQVVLATAPYHASKLLEELPDATPVRELIDGFRHEPIATLYFSFAKPLPLPWPMIGLSDGPGQWAFDRTALYGQENLIAVVISAHGPHETLEREALSQVVLQQLERQLQRPLPPVTWQQHIIEKRATFACTPALARPGHRTPVPGLWLAGDYVDCDYPGTLEGAVRNGVRTAQGVLQAEA